MIWMKFPHGIEPNPLVLLTWRHVLQICMMNTQNPRAESSQSWTMWCVIPWRPLHALLYTIMLYSSRSSSVSLPHNTTWRMPVFDAYQITALQEVIHQVVSPQYESDLLWSALRHGTIDEAFAAFNRAFEAKLSKAAKAGLGTALQQKFNGRGKGLITYSRPAHMYAAKYICDRKILRRQRLKVADRLNELRKYAEKRTNLASQLQLWNGICRTEGFKQDFATWILENELATFVPLAAPSFQWLQNI